MLKELTGNKELIETGDGDSSSGSDDAPSEDNLDIDQICQLIPAVDKKLKNALKKSKLKDVTKLEKKDDEALKNQKLLDKAKKVEEGEKLKPVMRKKTILPSAKPEP